MIKRLASSPKKKEKIVEIYCENKFDVGACFGVLVL